MNTKHDKEIEIAYVPVKIEPTEETEILEGDENYCSLVDFPLQTEFKEEENLNTDTRTDDETSTGVKIEPLEQRDTSDEDEHSYNLVSSSLSLKHEIDEGAETLETVESSSANYEYRELESSCSSLETTTECTTEYETGIEVKYLDIDPHFIKSR